MENNTLMKLAGYFQEEGVNTVDLVVAMKELAIDDYEVTFIISKAI